MRRENEEYNFEICRSWSQSDNKSIRFVVKTILLRPSLIAIEWDFNP